MQPQIFESRTSGLWPRFVTKLIGTWVLTYYMTIFIASFVGLLSESIYIFALVIVLSILTASYFIIKDLPLKWNNRVVLNFQDKTLSIFNRNASSKEMDVLDFEGQRFHFSDIDSYSTKNYESVVFSSYYLISISVNGSKLKLLSLKDASVFSEVVSLLANDAGLEIK